MAERESRLSLTPFARCSATLCRLFRVHRDRATRIFVSRPSERRQRRQLPPVLPPCTHPYPPCAACHSFAREHTRALRAHGRHFSFFAFTSSPLCRKSLYNSRFGVKVFPKILHRGEASAPHPPSDCNRPPNDRSTRTHPGRREPRKAPCKMPKSGGNCTKVPDRGAVGVGEGISRKAFTPYGLSISVLTHGG